MAQNQPVLVHINFDLGRVRVRVSQTGSNGVHWLLREGGNLFEKKKAMQMKKKSTQS